MIRRAPISLALAAAVLLTGCSARTGAPALPALSAAPSRAQMTATLRAHAVIGFSVDTPQRAATAAAQGVNTTILYGGAPAPGSDLASALKSHGIDVVDGEVSGILSEWECHRTHTVKPPPKSYGYNPYCRTDWDPRIKSEAIVLRDVSAIVERDSRRPYVVAYWVLDDWPWWDPGSGRALLQKMHALIAARTPGKPAFCGFGAGVGKPGKVDWDPGTAKNYSNAGCDVVGWYNYSPFGRRHPSLGKELDWTMSALLPAMAKSLLKYGWQMARTPLYGIGQAWGGSYDKRFYQPGLTQGEMLDQARAFCKFGATYIGWYAWDDSGFEKRTQTPNDSDEISNGIAAGLGACRSVWHDDTDR